MKVVFPVVVIAVGVPNPLVGVIVVAVGGAPYPGDASKDADAKANAHRVN